MEKKVGYKEDIRSKVLDGVKKITNAVKGTLGADGGCVLISEGVVADYGFHRFKLKVTKDGYTVAKHFELSDAFEVIGAMAIKEATEKTVQQAGDGTTTTAILSEALILKGFEAIDAGASPTKVKKEIDLAVLRVIEKLKLASTSIDGDVEKIKQVASVSANNDAIIGQLIADAYSKIGDVGVINIDESETSKTYINVSQGFKLDGGLSAPFFINTTKDECEVKEPYILLYDKPIHLMKDIKKIVEEVCGKKQSPLVIVCPEIDGEALAYLATNSQKRLLSACVINSPYFGDERREVMEDLAVTIGATYITEISGISIQNVQLHHLGQAKKVVAGKDFSVFIEGAENKSEKEDLLANLKMNLVEEKSEDKKEYTENRIARINGGVAVIYVGGATEVEMKEKKDRVEDAVKATRAAVAEGIISGGGTAYLMASKDESGIMKDVLLSPLKTLCDNSGVSFQEILSKINSSKIEGFGYNAKTEVMEDLMVAGIVDPVKVLRCALINAASVAGQLLTTNCVISDVY